MDTREPVQITAEGQTLVITLDLPAYRAMLGSRDAREGAVAFAERRRPVWQGR